jgi:dTMP kinase
VPDGLFVTFEGIEGTGKSTQVGLAARRLAERGVDHLVTRVPGGTPLGQTLRAFLLARRERPAEPLVEALLMVADRADHVASVIAPALAQGKVVLCDRFADATLAYQGGGSGVDPDLLARMNRAATRSLVPDLTVLLDLEPARALERLAARAGALDRFESEPQAFFDRVRRAYHELAAREPARWLVVGADSAAAAIADAIGREIERRLAVKSAAQTGFPKT